MVNDAGGAGRRDQQEALRRVMHQTIVEQYKKLIPVIQFRKNNKEIDEFNTVECVICMDTFTNGAKVRKIPSCRHIFHDDCLMKWLSGAQQQEAQKCPMCNSDVTVEILEKAIEEEANAKKGGFLGLGIKSPNKAKKDKQPSSNPHRAQERPPPPQNPPESRRRSNNQPIVQDLPPGRVENDVELRNIDSLRDQENSVEQPG